MKALAEPPTANHETVNESVLRRRLNRQAANAIKARQKGEETELERLERERDRRREREKNKREISRRMIRRMLGGRVYHPIQEAYEYWLALRCGWDLAAPTFAIDITGRRVDALLGYVWLWWKGTHYETRETLIRLSRRKTGKPTTENEDERREIHSNMRELLSRYRGYDA